MHHGGVFAVGQPELARADQAAVAARQAHGPPARLVNQAHDVLLHFASQHPFHHFHRLGVGHAHALNEVALLAQALERRFNLRAAAVHHHGVDAHQLEQHHIFGKRRLQGRVGHGVAAIFDDHGFAVIFADIGQRLRQNGRLLPGGSGGSNTGLSHEKFLLRK